MPHVASYELDVWSRVADIVKAAEAGAVATGYAFEDARLELHAELARDYVDLRGFDAEAKLLADTITVYNDALNLTRERLNAKIAPPIDEQRALTQLSDAQAQASDLALRRAALVDALAELTGRAAAEYKLASSAALPPLPRRPRAAPGDVLRRRPDVAAAEREAYAASEYIGVATAAFYPRFTIGLLGGTNDTALRLFDPVNTFYTVGPSVSAPIFDFGLRQAQLEEAKARFQNSGGALPRDRAPRRERDSGRPHLPPLARRRGAPNRRGCGGGEKSRGYVDGALSRRRRVLPRRRHRAGRRARRPKCGDRHPYA